jgi:hypothetical protein
VILGEDRKARHAILRKALLCLAWQHCYGRTLTIGRSLHALARAR